MIPEKTGRTKVESTLKGEKIGLTIDPESTEHLMGLLTNLYADPELAVIREYSTNARDSHVEAGVDRPISVILPNPLNPNIKIQDWGVGLDIDDMRETYTQYGASTKRATNAAVGMLGLGCKSALAYKEQFTVVSVKNGRKIQASITTNEEGSGELTVVSDKKTDEENGVTIIVPASPSSDLTKKAEEFFQYWPEDSVLINDKEPERLEGTRFKDKYVISQNTNYNYYDNKGKHFAVMGGVPYPLNIPEDKDIFKRDQSLTIFAEIGDFHFTPSREEMLDTPKTRKFISDSLDEINDLIVNHIEDEIGACNTGWEYLRKLNEFNKLWDNKLFRRNKFNFNGKTPPERYSPIPSTEENLITLTRRSASYSQSECTTAFSFLSSDWHSYFFVTGFSPKTYTHLHNRKFTEYLTAIDYKPDKTFKDYNGNDVTKERQNFALIRANELPDIFEGWVDPDKVVDWEDLKDIVKEWKKNNNITTPPANYGPSDKYDLFTIYDKRPLKDGISAKELNNCKNPFYFERPLKASDDYSYRLNKISLTMGRILETYPDAKFVLVPSNRINRIKKNVKHIKEGFEFGEILFKRWSDKLSDEEILALYSEIIDDPLLDIVSSANKKKKIIDSKLSEKIKKFDKVKTIFLDSPELENAKKQWERLGRTIDSDSDLISNFYEDIKKYPLIEKHSFNYNLDDEYLKDVSFYINNKYKTKVEK